MLLVTETDERGLERVLVLPHGSFNSFFTSAEGGEGMDLHINPGLLAYASEYDRDCDAVREAVLLEAASRMQVPPEQVLAQNLSQLKAVTDKAFDETYLQARRRSKSRFGVFSR
jgi:hypothetical protein